jgi:hypothetical protein
LAENEAQAPKSQQSSALDDCQYSDSSDIQKKEQLKARRLRNVLRIYDRGAVEIAFDDENGYIIVEVIAAKICRSVINVGHKILG